MTLSARYSNPARRRCRRERRRGAVMAEFVFVCLALMVVIFGCVELNRMVLVYTAVANSAKAGARYAITHGLDRTGSGMDGPAIGTDNVQTVVRNFAGASALNSTNVNVTVTYSAGDNLSSQPVGGAGTNVAVQVTYVYDPLFSLLPLGVTLSSTSQGTITF